MLVQAGVVWHETGGTYTHMVRPTAAGYSYGEGHGVWWQVQ